MLALGTAHSPEDANGQRELSPLAAQGLEVWQQQNCVACHAVFGLGGHVGPDLTNVWRRRPVQMLSLRLDKGGPGMPDLGLKSSDVSALLAYLQYLDRLGTYPLPQLTSPGFGISGKQAQTL